MSGPLPPAPYLVLGCARAGAVAAAALSDAAGAGAVRVWDEYSGAETAQRAAPLRARGVEVHLGPWEPALLDGAATIVKSPGVPMAHPAIMAGAERGVIVCDELEIGHRLARRPLLAVTGTDGKSTVCALIAAALGDPDGPVPVAGNTSFGPPLCGVAREGGPVVVETSSYQLEACTGPFAALAVLTNLTADHLHRHRTIARYATAKRRLFAHAGRAVPLAVLPAVPGFARALAAELRAAGTIVATFGAAAHADYRIVDSRWDARRGRTTLRTPDGELVLHSRLPGPHNAENLAAALAAADLYGIARAGSVPALERMAGVPGRWEQVDAGQDFMVVVDFAHTPAGLTRALETARSVTGPAGRVHLVLSSGGGNDAGYRPRLGEIASRLADRVAITEGNGRGEPRARVIAAIRAGTTGAAEVAAVPDRRAAIAWAISDAAAGDVVLVVDRGAAPRLLANRAGGGRAFDDRIVAREELARLLGAARTSGSVGRWDRRPTRQMSRR